MDSVLQRHCARYIYVVPDGLKELMSDISREVLRSDPENIYTFIADYLDALMITRENARVAARMVQSITEITENIISLLENTGIDRRDAENVANVMQHVFKKYIDVKPGPKRDIDEEEIINEILTSAHITFEEANKAATIIQQAFLKFKEKKDREQTLLTGIIDWRVAARSTIYLYRHTGVSNEDANRAATLIKAAYKGYYTRKVMKRLAEESIHVFDEEESDTSEYSSQDMEEGDAEFQEILEVVTEIIEEILDRITSMAGIGTDTDFTARTSGTILDNEVIPDVIEQAYLKTLESHAENG